MCRTTAFFVADGATFGATGAGVGMTVTGIFTVIDGEGGGGVIWMTGATGATGSAGVPIQSSRVT